VALTPKELELAEKLGGILMPYAGRLRSAAIARRGRFVHYTSAVAALEIIKTKRLWMRSTTCMSDYREVQHGFDTLNKFFNDPAGKSAFSEALNQAPTASQKKPLSCLINGGRTFSSKLIFHLSPNMTTARTSMGDFPCGGRLAAPSHASLWF
jgi:hypothetical protein